MLKISILVLTLLGALASGALGMKWIGDASESQQQIETLRAMGVDTNELDQALKGAYALIGSLILGIVAAITVFRGQKKVAAALLLVAGLAPLLFTTKVLIFTWMLILAGLLAFRLKDSAGVPTIAEAASS